MKTQNITAVVITKNESAMIEGCLRCLQWCTAVIVIDTGSSDDTVAKAERLGARVIQLNLVSFAKIRTEALKYVQTDWCIYIDADERVTPTLAKEVAVLIETSAANALEMHRENIFFGQHVEHGGWEKDSVTRVFKKTSLKRWFGDIHESPEFSGMAVLCQTPLIHFTHRTVKDGLIKSAQWTYMEAELLHAAHIPTVTFFTLIRKGMMEFIRRGIFKKGYKDGEVGLIEALIQGINRVLVYAQVWELQQKPPIEKRYSDYETELFKAWNSENNT